MRAIEGIDFYGSIAGGFGYYTLHPTRSKTFSILF
jgi:hypothetical protein